MQLPDDKQLEQFIHRQLKKLPEHQAPEALIGNVMASLAARHALPWYKKPWSDWPKTNQNIFLFALLALVGTIAWIAAAFLPNVSMASLMEKSRLVSWIPDVTRSLFNAGVLMAGNIRYEWLLGILAACVLFYCWCVAAGVAVFRVVTQRKFSL